MATRENEYGTAASHADFYELFSAAFGFPTYELAWALTNGSFKADYDEIAAELGVAASFDDAGLHGLGADALFDELKREYSRLYLSPGWLRKIYPYESAFLFDRSGERGMPAVIVTRAAADVELFMRRVGILPDDHAREPVDRIDKELAVMRSAYANQVAALDRGEQGVAEAWALLANEFRVRHLDTWVREFMRCTIGASRHESYAALAQAFLQVYSPAFASCADADGVAAGVGAAMGSR